MGQNVTQLQPEQTLQSLNPIEKSTIEPRQDAQTLLLGMRLETTDNCVGVEIKYILVTHQNLSFF